MAFRYGIIISTAIIILVYGILKPEHNWDMVAYVASAYHKDGYKGANLTSETYGEIKKEVSNKKFSLLVSGEYRETVFLEILRLWNSSYPSIRLESHISN